MRTTLKRGIGRGAGLNGNGHSVLPPGAFTPMARYGQAPPGRRGFGRRVAGFFLWLGVLVLMVAGGAAGGLYLYGHDFASATSPHSKAMKRAAKRLDYVAPGKPAVALVLGTDHRYVDGKDPGRSDTMMLIRTDPESHTVSMLSFPRDMAVEIHCPGRGSFVDKINAAYPLCGPSGPLETIKALTHVPINYLISVNFVGFIQVVNKLGGVYIDVDRKYFNDHTGPFGYAAINLQAGYQRLSGKQALDFVRYRHTDSDLYRVARQQEFVRSFREQVSSNFSPFSVPSLVNAITHNIEVAEGGRKLEGKQVYDYALFAYGLPPGHVFQNKIQNVVCGLGCQASTDDIQKAVQSFSNPDVAASKDANAAALGKKIKTKAPPPASVTVTVLNWSGVAGAAANTSYLLGQRGYRTLIPPNNLKADAPSLVFHTKIYFDPAQTRSKAAAAALKSLMEPAEVAPLPRKAGLLALDPGSKLMVVLGTAFHTLAPVPQRVIPKHQPPYIRFDSTAGTDLLRPLVHKVKFPLLTPTVLERTSYPDTQPGDTPVRQYYIAGHNKAVRLVFKTAGNEYWGIQETDWGGAPALKDKSFQHSLGGREFDLYYSGSSLHMVVLHRGKATYWVVNTLLDSLSNETMLAIAKGLKPLTTGK